MARKVTYDQIHFDVMVCHDISEEQRIEILLFIREFKQKVSAIIKEEIPHELTETVTINVRS